MKVIYLAGGAFAAVFLLSVSSCSFEKVSQGHVGVKVNNIGSGAGVNPRPLGVGWYFTPPGVTIYEYPIFTNNYTWKDEERFTFQDRNGLSVAAEVSVAYRANPSKAPILFQKYRVDMDGIVNGALRNTVRNAIVANAARMPVDQIYGPQKASLIEKSRKDASAYLEPYGLHIEQLFWASNIILPGNIRDQINARVANEQAAIAEQAKVATAQARARSAIATAEGKAKAMEIEQQAIENAQSSAEYLKYRAIEKWNGRLPTYMAPGAPMPFVGSIGER